MWQKWVKKSNEKKVNKIMLKNKLIFEVDNTDDWEISQVNFEHDGKGNCNQMLINITRVEKDGE